MNNKYIRLKDRIAKVDTEDTECYYFDNLKKFVYKDEDYKVADKIEELCDVLVIEEKNIYNNDTHKYLMGQPFIFEEDGYLSKTLSTKGAIWTDKGLIYVAKMNKKGELKLI